MTSDAAGARLGRVYSVGCHGGLFATLPNSARVHKAEPDRYVINEITPAISWVSAGGYYTMFLPTGGGLVIIDPAPALREVIITAIRSTTPEQISQSYTVIPLLITSARRISSRLLRRM